MARQGLVAVHVREDRIVESLDAWLVDELQPYRLKSAFTERADARGRRSDASVTTALG